MVCACFTATAPAAITGTWISPFFSTSPSKLQQNWPAIEAASIKYDVDVRLLSALIIAESNGENDIVNKESAACMMQVVSGERIAGRPLAQELTSSVDLCLKWGLQIYTAYRKRLGGNDCKAITAYNRGVNWVKKNGYKTRFFKRVSDVYKELWGEQLKCHGNS